VHLVGIYILKKTLWGFLAKTMGNTQNSSQLYQNKNYSEGLGAANWMQTEHT
jgi:hypothetical protein